jgi:hypothetical protein
MARWRANHVTERAASLRKWRKDNDDHVRTYKAEYNQEHPDKRRTESRKQYVKDPDAFWARNLKNKYGITPEEYYEMLVKQDGKCAVCGLPEAENRRKFDVDHDHRTGKSTNTAVLVRGLLCEGCNRALGLCHDDPVVLRALADYVERTRPTDINPSPKPRTKAPTDVGAKVRGIVFF